MDLGVRSSLLPLSCLSKLQYLCLLSHSPFSINSNPFISYVCKSISHVSLYLVTHRVKVKAERKVKARKVSKAKVKRETKTAKAKEQKAKDGKASHNHGV